MKSKPDAAGTIRSFGDVRSNRAVNSDTYVRTRRILAGDIKVGGSIFCMWGTYDQPNRANSRWRDIAHHWERTTVVDVNELGSGYIQAAVSGQLRRVHISNIRIAR